MLVNNAIEIMESWRLRGEKWFKEIPPWMEPLLKMSREGEANAKKDSHLRQRDHQ